MNAAQKERARWLAASDASDAADRAMLDAENAAERASIDATVARDALDAALLRARPMTLQACVDWLALVPHVVVASRGPRVALTDGHGMLIATAAAPSVDPDPRSRVKQPIAFASIESASMTVANGDCVIHRKNGVRALWSACSGDGTIQIGRGVYQCRLVRQWLLSPARAIGMRTITLADHQSGAGYGLLAGSVRWDAALMSTLAKPDRKWGGR